LGQGVNWDGIYEDKSVRQVVNIDGIFEHKIMSQAAQLGCIYFYKGCNRSPYDFL
jgi:hypothetical protein